MRVNNKKYLLIVILVGVILTGVVIFRPKENIQLGNVILKQEVNNKTFAMYKEDTENNYVPFEEADFPKGYYLNIEKSKCIDNNGNKLEGVLSYENNEVTITSGNTTYCYLYFDKSVGLKIIESNPANLNENQAGMFRYQGSKDVVNNNYICFGTSDQNTCTTNPDKYMYRIIGIDEQSYELKLIKETPIKEIKNDEEITTFPYHHSTDQNDYINFSWDKSDIYKRLNGKSVNNTEYSNIFIDSEYYDYLEDKKWQDIISPHEMLIGTVHENYIGNPEQAYQIEQGKGLVRWAEREAFKNYITEEMNCHTYDVDDRVGCDCTKYWNTKTISKIFLYNITDYYYAIKENGLDCMQNSSSKTDECFNGWMLDAQHYSTSMIFFGAEFTNLVYDSLSYMPNRGLGGVHCSNDTEIKPVFYLINTINLTGYGTIDTPYIIN